MPSTTPDSTASIVMYGTGWCGDCTRSKAALNRMGQPFDYIDVENDEEASATAQRISGAMRIPVIVFPDGQYLVEPSDSALREAVDALRA